MAFGYLIAILRDRLFREVGWFFSEEKGEFVAGNEWLRGEWAC